MVCVTPYRSARNRLGDSDSLISVISSGLSALVWAMPYLGMASTRYLTAMVDLG